MQRLMEKKSVVRGALLIFVLFPVFFWLEIPFRFCCGVPWRAGKRGPNSPHQHLQLVFIFDA